jgi:hypothetical protein
MTLSSQSILSKDGATLTGPQTSTVVLKNPVKFPSCNGLGASAICVTADHSWFSGFRLDGNKSQNNQDVYGLLVNGNDARLWGLYMTDFRGSKAYGGGISIRDVDHPFLLNAVLQESGGDGLDIFGTASHGIFSDILAIHNGLLGVEAENSGQKRPHSLLISNILATRNGATNFQMNGTDDVLVNDILTESGGAGPDSNNSNARIRYSNRVLLSSFVFRGPANGGPQGAFYPVGLSFDHEGTAEQNRDIVAIGGMISGYTSSGVSISRSDAAPASGTNGLTLIGINSTENEGYGADFGNIRSNDDNVGFIAAADVCKKKSK